MGDVLEYIVDGVSGLVPGGVDGTCIVAGCCSAGEVGKGYILGPSSDPEATLGVGPLTDRLRDVLAMAGQSAVVLAVPVAGQAGGYARLVGHSGSGPEGTLSGVPGSNADAIVEIVTAGALGTATYKLSLDNGTTWDAPTATPANGQIAIGETGITLVLDDSKDLVDGDRYTATIRAAIGPVAQVGDGPAIAVSGSPLARAEVIIRVTKAGTLNEAQYQISLDGGDSYSLSRTMPMDGTISVGDTGVTVTLAVDSYVLGTAYSFEVQAPVPSISAVVSALERPLELYDVEFVYVVGASDSSDWSALGVQADQLWNAHRPTFFICEARLPYDGEDLDDWVAAMVADRDGFAHRFVAVSVDFGEVADSIGRSLTRNFAGLLAGRIISIPVCRAPGRVRDGGISQAGLPDALNNAQCAVLEAAGYIVGKRYAGLESVYFGDARTMAEDTSDYRYIPVVRTVFKGVRISRIQALKSLYDESGDPMREDGAAGINFLKANLENGLNTMVASYPSELAGYVVNIPDGQDIVNNGLAVELKLVGIPIIREIKLFASYYYAGSAFDPRLA
ncbi:DUF2586 domain-containing protein [Maridesulfovibrio bastinii]|uniref:DUF2586 domain-containing protein n=1 Tax=Maridesulfovibrio bastinii TaxID=47157 RepID=UPI000403ADDA|nr:DUF2586 domain-containing protein [Maridesulfovibrio bastinii]